MRKKPRQERSRQMVEVLIDAAAQTVTDTLQQTADPGIIPALPTAAYPVRRSSEPASGHAFFGVTAERP